MTFDPTSSLARRQDPESIRNFRIPALDLDNVYGGGPAASPALYDQSVDRGQTTMLLEEIPGSAARTIDGQPRYDLPRNSQNVAVIGDPRNDENLMVSQLHVAMLRFHNAVVADVKADLGAAYTPEETFAEAQRIVRWHYQWMIVHEFLPRTIGQATTTTIITNGRRFYSWRNDPYIPVEFSVAAYRSAIRRSARATAATLARARPMRPSSSSASSSSRATRTRPTPRTCAAAAGLRAGSSTGKRSLTSATAARGPTR